MHTIDGKDYVLEASLRADFAILRAKHADRMGNLTYNKTARNFGPVMAMAARTVVAEVDEVVENGGIDPEIVERRACWWIGSSWEDAMLMKPCREKM